MDEGKVCKLAKQSRGTGVSTGRFRAAPAPDDAAENRPLVNAAVEAAKRGDRDAMRLLYVRYADSIYGYVKSLVRDEHEAEDVTQQVFTKLMRIIGKYEQRDVPFAAWILRVAHNVAVDHLRRRRAVPVEEVRLADAAAEDLGRERAATFREALAELPKDQREVLVMRHVLGMSPTEIAERLHKSEGAIHGLHHRGRGTLQAALTARGAAPATVAAV
jgi:RNA polymerase sigma-70 factor (ECF subfamily)